MITKTKEFVQDNNDMYFLEIVADKIVVNDNYSGVLILDRNLNVLKSLPLIEGIRIYTSYTNPINEEILLYCPDNNIIVYVNLKDYDYKIIQLNDGVDNLIFAEVYEWNENYVILSTYEFEFVKIHIKKSSLERIELGVAEQLYSCVYKPVELHEKCDTVKEDSMHVMLNENKIEVFVNGSMEVLYPIDNFIFLKSKFMSDYEDVFLIIMCSNSSNIDHSKLLIYRICT